MPHPAPLPFEQRPFSVADAVQLGISRERLRRGDLRRPFRGVRVAAAAPTPGDLEARCRDYAPRLAPGQFFSHETALLLHGVPMPPYPYSPKIHISTHRPAREPRMVGVCGHRLQKRDPAARFVRGLPVEDPARAWRQCAFSWRLHDLIAAADALVCDPNPLASVDALIREVDEMGDVRRLLRAALREVRPRVRSPRETALRLELLQANLPEPVTGWDLRTRYGEFVAELDLAYPRWLVGVEYDGRGHASDTYQFQRDADRWAAIRAEGWDHVRILHHHLHPRPEPAVRMVRDALLRAGWMPARA